MAAFASQGMKIYYSCAATVAPAPLDLTVVGKPKWLVLTVELAGAVPRLWEQLWPGYLDAAGTARLTAA